MSEAMIFIFCFLFFGWFLFIATRNKPENHRNKPEQPKPSNVTKPIRYNRPATPPVSKPRPPKYIKGQRIPPRRETPAEVVEKAEPRQKESTSLHHNSSIGQYDGIADYTTWK